MQPSKTPDATSSHDPHRSCIAAVATVLDGVWFRTFTAVVGISTGAYASVMSAEIRDGLPFGSSFPTPSNIAFSLGRTNPPLWLFAVMSVATLFAVFGSQWAARVRRDAAIRNADDARRELLEQLRTMPAPDFMARVDAEVRQAVEHFRDAVILFETLYQEQVDAEGPPSAEEAIGHLRLAAPVVRQLLSALARLASEFDTRTADARYGTNLMHVVHPDEVQADAVSVLRKWLHFAPHEVSVDRLGAVLVLVPSWSVAMTGTAVEALVPDDNVARTPFALPVPAVGQEKSPTGLWRVLPGAPIAWQRGEAVYYRNLEQIESWAAKKGDYEQTVVEQLRDRFRSTDPWLKSMWSFPLVSPERGPDPSRSASWVVNVHSSRPSFLLDGGRAEAMFRHAVSPVIAMLRTLLDRLETLGAVAPDHVVSYVVASTDGEVSDDKTT